MVSSQINRTVGYLKPNVVYLFTYFVVLRHKLRPGLMAKFGFKYKLNVRIGWPGLADVLLASMCREKTELTH